jgi:FAD synthetase
MTRITYQDLPRIRTEHSEDKIVICSGSFDIIHAGHVLFFEDCKKLGSPLVTIVAGDEILKKNKGRGIIPEEARIKLIDSLKPIDYTVLDDFSQSSDNLYYAIEYAIELLRPDIYVVNDDASNLSYRRKFSERLGVRLEVLPRNCPESFGKISTSKIIERIQDLNYE